MKCNPWRWFWGLVPIIMLGWLAILVERERIETDLATRAKEALTRAGHGWASIAFAGRDGILLGRATEEGEPPKALGQAMDTWGVRSVTNSALLIDKAEKYEWTAIRRDNRIRIDGLVPSERTRRDVMGMVKASFPRLDIDDRMKLARGAPPLDTWLGGVGFGVKQLAQLKQGQVDLEQTSLTVSGEAIDAKAYRSVKSALAGGLPQGIRLKQEAVKAPLVKPFTWTARLNREQLVLSGYAPSDVVRDGLLAAARQALPKLKIIDQLEPGDGAPSGFATVAGNALVGLAKLEEGSAEISDAGLTFTGTAETAAQAEAVRALLKQGVRAPFRLSEQIRHREPLIKTASPYVTSARVGEVGITLSGFVPGDEARRALIAAAGRRFAGRQIRDEMQIAAGQPPGWQNCVESGMAALQRLGNGSASLSDRRLEVSGVSESEALAQALPGEVRASAGRDCDTDVRVALKVDPRRVADEEARRVADAVARQRTEAEAIARQRAEAQAEARRKAEDEARRRAEADASRLRAEADAARLRAAAQSAADAARRQQLAAACQEALATVVREGVINFQRASAVIEEGSHPTLDKLAQAANRCPELKVEIGGHTDSDGTPERNQRLSDRRAQAVSDYLVQAGVDAGRLTAVGYGETRNVAPNDTPSNKARNRRIELSVTSN